MEIDAQGRALPCGRTGPNRIALLDAGFNESIGGNNKPRSERWGRRYKIIIAGAGVAGPTAAAKVLGAGHDVTMCEQASELIEVVAALQLGANATHVLRHLGLGAP